LVTGASGPFEALVSGQASPAKIDLGKFHAFHNIKDLQGRIPLASAEDARRLKALIVALSQQTGIVSDFTAMFTVLESAQLHSRASRGQERFVQPLTQNLCLARREALASPGSAVCEASRRFRKDGPGSVPARPYSADDPATAESESVKWIHWLTHSCEKNR
jgi:hypothetical protein